MTENRTSGDSLDFLQSSDCSQTEVSDDYQKDEQNKCWDKSPDVNEDAEDTNGQTVEQ